MSQRLNNSWISTTIPGAYSQVSIKSNPIGFSSSGNVVIIGEADGGDVYSNVALKDNYFTPDQFSKIQSTYISGQIVDAFKAFTAPSSDSDITGSANRIYIVKTNNSTKAQSVLDTDYGIFKDLNFGVNGLKYKYQVTSIATEVAPTVSGAAVAVFGAGLNGTTFGVRLNGSADTIIALSATPGDHNNIANLIIELNAQLPAGIVASAGTIVNSFKLTMAVDAAAYRKGYGKSFELVELAPANLASLGHAAGLVVSAVEPGVEVAASRSDTGFSETLDINAAIALSIGYVGTSAVMTIDQSLKTLVVTRVGGAGADLSINLNNYKTISDLAVFISAQTGYSASAGNGSQQLAPSALDEVAAIGICSSAAVKPGRVKKANYDFKRVMSTSRALAFEATAKAGLPAPMANPAFLAGGARGATSSADITNALAQIAGISVNIVVPLFSRDASADLAEGLTDSGSNYTIAAINAAVKSHCLTYSTPKLKKHRIAILSYWNNSFQEAKDLAQSLAHYRVSLCIQKSTQVDSFGNLTSFQPWYTACTAAGMQAGGFYKAIVNKYANVVSFTDPSGLDSGSPGDVETALDSGLLILTADVAGNRWVSDQTTHTYDSSFVLNSVQAVYASDLIALDLADSFQKAFVGKSLADVNSGVARTFLNQKMAEFKKLKLIAGSVDAPMGYKNDKITMSGPVMDVSVEIKLATAIYFIALDLSFSEVQSAS